MLFLKSPISCIKLWKILVKSYKIHTQEISKIRVQLRKWTGLCTCIFLWFQYLIDFMLSIENQVKGWTNEPKHNQKNVWKTLGEIHAKWKLNYVEFSFWLCIGFMYSYVFVHPLASKPRWMKAIQVTYLPSYTQRRTLIHWFIYIVHFQLLLSKTKENYLLYNVTINW